jgi:hypothetical protein
MICPKCSNTEPEDAVYCSNCGSSLASRAADGGQAARPAPDASRAATAPPPEATKPAHEDYTRTKTAGPPKPQQRPGAASSKGFLASLFDVGFNSFVTPKVVKAVYVLVMILTALWVLAFAVGAFRLNTVLGIIVLFILCPIFFVVYLALWRIVLELVMVVFRIAEDVRSIRLRRDLLPDGLGRSDAEIGTQL